MGKRTTRRRAVAGITAATVSVAILFDEKEQPHVEPSPPAIVATPPAWAGPVADRIQIVHTPPV